MDIFYDNHWSGFIHTKIRRKKKSDQYNIHMYDLQAE